MTILREEGAGDVGGVFHCFSGDAWLAKDALDLGFYLSFSGVLTFKNATMLRDIAKDRSPGPSHGRNGLSLSGACSLSRETE